MITLNTFSNQPTEHELEKASNSYLMSLIALMAGLPFPIINLLATLIFYVGNRKGTYFVRWHCVQALLSQLSLLFVNSYGFWWTISIVFTTEKINNHYIAYMLTAFVFNVFEMIATIYTAIQTRKGQHIEWWCFGNITNAICKP
jgi:uncharacterized membrane protein